MTPATILSSYKVNTYTYDLIQNGRQLAIVHDDPCLSIYNRVDLLNLHPRVMDLFDRSEGTQYHIHSEGFEVSKTEIYDPYHRSDNSVYRSISIVWSDHDVMSDNVALYKAKYKAILSMSRVSKRVFSYRILNRLQPDKDLKPVVGGALSLFVYNILYPIYLIDSALGKEIVTCPD